MNKYFKEQLDAGPIDGESKNVMLFYIVESDDGKVMLRINSDAVDNLAEKYVCVNHDTAVPVLKLKEQL